jgi:hypothetical protein
MARDLPLASDPHSRRKTMRDKYRDNDDVRRPLEGDARTSGSSDSKSEARGDAREAAGNTARDTDANPTGPKGNDKTRHRDDRPDEFDETLDQS